MSGVAKRRLFGRTIRWTWGLTVALVFHMALYWGVALTRDSKQKLRRQERQFTEIQYFDAKAADRSELLSQQMSLFDPRPLLLPTEWNAANAANLVEYWQEEAEIFPQFTPMFELEDGNYIDDFGNVPASFEQLADAQTEFDLPPFRQLGRQMQSGDYEQAPGVALLVRDPASGRELWRITIYNEAVEELGTQWPEWRPAVLLATVEDSFQVGGFSLIESSGFEGVDRLLNQLAYRNFSRFGQLEDGVYELEFIP